MSLNTTKFEEILQNKLNTTNDPKEILLLSKSVEALIPTATMNDIKQEGLNQQQKLKQQMDKGVVLVDANNNIAKLNRFKHPDYDYLTGRGNNQANTIRKAWDKGVVKFTHGGNSSSYHNGTWNYKNMYECECGADDATKGFKIKVPAHTDIVAVSSHDGHHYWSLTDPDTNKGVSFAGCKNQDKYFTYTGQYTTTHTLGAFGQKGTAQRYHPEGVLPVHNLPYEKEYILTCYRPSGSRHGRDCSSRWLSGIAFLQNPYGLVWTSSMSQYLDVNGGTDVWHNDWSWNNQALAFIHKGHSRVINVPVVKGEQDRVFFIRIHGSNHPQQLKHLKVNGSEYALRPSNGGVMSSMLSGASQSTSWGYVECVIKQKDIPQDVLNSGGIIKITLDNTDYDHHFYFGEHGTYFVNPQETVKD